MTNHHAPLLLLSVIFFFATLTIAQSPQSIADVQIASVSGCVDVYPVTVNCSVATTTLLIQTVAGFPPNTVGLPRYYLYLDARVNGYSYFLTTSVWLNQNDPSNRSVFANVSAGGYYPSITGQLIDVAFSAPNAPGSPISASFAGFSYRFEGPPTLTSIAGCDGSGQSTLNCVPDAAVLELTGSGLLWYSQLWYVLFSIGGETSRKYDAYRAMSVVNDTYATLSLAEVYGGMLKPQHYAGVLLPFNLTSQALNSKGVEYSYTTNSLYVSFVPLPAPRITSYSVGDCNRIVKGNVATYNNCVPNLSVARIFGDYLYDARVTVGGVSCAPLYMSATTYYYFCVLPTFDFDPSVAYDVVVSNDGGNTTLPGVVQFTSAPTLSSIDPCIDRGGLQAQVYQGVQCPVGTTLTLRGARFPAADSVAVQFVVASSFGSPTTISLLAPTLINSTTVTATLPALDSLTAAAVYGVQGTVQVFFMSASVTTTTNAFVNAIYIPMDAPNVTSVTSTMCDSVSPLQLTNCRSMAVITVAGSNLAQRSGLTLSTIAAGVWLGHNYLLPVYFYNTTWYDSVTNTSVVFTLDYFDADTNPQLQPNVVYTILILANSGVSLVSNAFRLSLTYGAADSSGTSSSNKLSSGAITGIVIAAVVVAVLLVLVVVWLARRQLSSASQSWSSKSPTTDSMQWSIRDDAGGASDEYKGVELQ